MNKEDFINNAKIHENLKTEINSYYIKYKFLSTTISYTINSFTIIAVTCLLLLSFFNYIFFVLLGYLLFIVFKDSLLKSYIKNSFFIIVKNEKKYYFLTKSVMDFRDIFEENELIFIKYKLSIIKNCNTFSWKQAYDYVKVIKLIHDKRNKDIK